MVFTQRRCKISAGNMQKEDIKAFLTLKIKKYYTLWKMADSFVKNISALFYKVLKSVSRKRWRGENI